MKKLIPFILIINFYSCKAPEPAKEEPRIPTIVSEDIVIFKENESYRFSLVTKMPDPQYSSDRLNPEKYSQGQLHFYCQDNCPKFVKVDESTGDVNLMPTNNDAGIYKINFIVKSEIYQAEKAIFFLIKDVDRLPYFSETPIVKIKENEKLEYKLAASDPDYDKVYYRCKFCVESMYVVDDVL